MLKATWGEKIIGNGGIGLGMAQYSQDYDERMVPVDDGAASPLAFAWADVVKPYLKSTQIFKCPSDSWSNRGPAYTTRRKAATMSYANNMLIGPMYKGVAAPTPISMATINQSAKNRDVDRVGDVWWHPLWA